MQAKRYFLSKVHTLKVRSMPMIEFSGQPLKGSTEDKWWYFDWAGRSARLFAALALIGCASVFCSAQDSMATPESDRLLYEYITKQPIHRGYMYCHVTIEYSSDYENRFCPGSRIFILMAQRALKQPTLDTHDDAELRRILGYLADALVAKRPSGPRLVPPIEGPVALSLARLSDLHESTTPDETFYYCYAEITYFDYPESPYCRYALAKLNVQLFEGQGPQIHDDAALYAILNAIIVKERR
jgi:hypothetical protein